MPKENRQAQRSESTKARLLEVARPLFAQKGFAGVSIEEIVALSGVSKGGIYHHFEGKEGLFLGVYRQLQREVADRLEADADAAPDPWAGLRAGCHAFLEASASPEFQRVVLLDAPSVLSWETWRAADAEFGLGSLEAGLRAAADAGFIGPEVPLEAAAQMLEGAMNDAAMWVARSEDQGRALEGAKYVLDRLLEGLRRA